MIQVTVQLQSPNFRRLTVECEGQILPGSEQVDPEVRLTFSFELDGTMRYFLVENIGETSFDDVYSERESFRDSDFRIIYYLHQSE